MALVSGRRRIAAGMSRVAVARDRSSGVLGDFLKDEKRNGTKKLIKEKNNENDE
jgi:hypothetical protein